MIGYLLADPKYMLDDLKDPARWPLRSAMFSKKVVCDECAVLLFENAAANNYMAESGKCLVVCTGTIFFMGLRGQSAVQRIAERIEHGDDLEAIYERCYGPSTILVVEKSASRVTALTDREGMQGAFIYDRGGQHVISSNPLFMAAVVDAKFDPIGAREYIHLGHCMEWRTIFEGIKRIRGGMKLSRGPLGWETKVLWRLQVNSSYAPDNDRQIIEKVHSLIGGTLGEVATTVENRIGLDLTGGSDSRTVLSFFVGDRRKVEATTAGAADHKDVIIARDVARQMAIPFYWYEDRPLPTISRNQVDAAIEQSGGLLSTLTILKGLEYYREKSNRYEIIMGGCGGPLFKDHYWLFEFNRINKSREPNWDRIVWLSTNNPIKDELTPSFKEGIREHLAAIFKRHSQIIQGANNQKTDFVYFDLRCPNGTGPQFSYTNQYLDIYHPLMDGRIVQYVINARPFIRKWNNLEFSLILRNSRELAWIPTDNGCPAVPSMGRYSYLRSHVARRFAGAAARKIRTYVLRRAATRPLYASDGLIDLVEKAGYDGLLDYGSMCLADILDRNTFEEIKSGTLPEGYGAYLSNLASAEMALTRAKRIRGEIIN